MAVFPGGGLDLHVDAVEEVSRTCIRDLVADINILVFEETCSGVELRAQLGEGVAALTDPQFHFHRDQSFRTPAHSVRRQRGWEIERGVVDDIRVCAGRRELVE
jgi:hypothetical protein